MITRSTNHMISTPYHLHDLVTWSQHVTYELHPDIKASSIPTSASPFILTSSHHRFPTSASWLRPGLIHHQSTRLHPIVDLEQVLGVLTSRSQWWWRERRFSLIDINESHWMSYFQINAYPGFSSGSVKGAFPQSRLIKTTGGSHGEWWAVRLAGRSLNPTLKDVNISFNNSTVLLNE